MPDDRVPDFIKPLRAATRGRVESVVRAAQRADEATNRKTPPRAKDRAPKSRGGRR